LAAAARLVGLVALERDDVSSAREPLERSLALSRELGDDRGAAWSTYGLAAVALAVGDLTQAAALGEACLRAFEQRANGTGSPRPWSTWHELRSRGATTARPHVFRLRRCTCAASSRSPP
jgi:hypothetical protein